MTLIPTLSQTYRELVKAAASRPDQASYPSTARRIEALLVDEIAALPQISKEVAITVLASGSLKALKSLPVEPFFAPHQWRSGIDVLFVLTQSATYRKEAEKRGFGLSDHERTKIFTSAMDGKIDASQPAIRAALAQGAPESWMLAQTLGRVLSPSDEMSKGYSPAAAALLAQALKTVARDEKKRDSLTDDLLTICVLPEPGMAAEGVFARLVVYALLGLKKPGKDSFENAAMAAFVEDIFSPAGRKLLTEQTKGLEAWLAGGWKTPPATVAAMEKKRGSWSAPRPRSRW